MFFKYNKNIAFLQIVSPALSALELVQKGYQSDVRQSGWWMPGGLEDGSQEIRSHPVVCIMDVMWLSGGLGMGVLQGGSQRVIWRSGVHSDVYPSTDTGLKSSTSLSSQDS